jgi:hypothetical protein
MKIVRMYPGYHKWNVYSRCLKYGRGAARRKGKWQNRSGSFLSEINGQCGGKEGFESTLFPWKLRHQNAGRSTMQVLRSPVLQRGANQGRNNLRIPPPKKNDQIPQPTSLKFSPKQRSRRRTQRRSGWLSGSLLATRAGEIPSAGIFYSRRWSGSPIGPW